MRRVCERLAERHGFAIVARFSDAAISGGTAQRAGYQALLEAARRGELDVIVADDTSRLWRNLAEQAPRMAELADLGVHVVTHDLDTRTESAGMLSAVLDASSEAYRREIGRRTRRGLEGLARGAARPAAERTATSSSTASGASTQRRPPSCASCSSASRPARRFEASPRLERARHAVARGGVESRRARA